MHEQVADFLGVSTEGFQEVRPANVAQVPRSDVCHQILGNRVVRGVGGLVPTTLRRWVKRQLLKPPGGIVIDDRSRDYLRHRYDGLSERLASEFGIAFAQKWGL